MKKRLTASALIAAAGNSTRMGGNNKQFLTFHGKPVLAHTLLAFSSLPEITELVVVSRREDIPLTEKLVADFSIPKVKAIVPGGDTRQASVFAGLLHAKEDIVLIHDGARPFVEKVKIRELIEALDSCPAAALGVPVKDTIKRVAQNGLVTETLPREELWQIQTPQGFRTEEIIAAHRKAEEQNVSVTDDCALAEYIGIPVRIVPGSYRNIKITTPEDIPLAEAYACKE